MWDFFHGLVGWIASSIGWLFGQAVPDANAQQLPQLTGFWLAVYAIAASVVAAAGTMGKAFYDDRDKERKEQTTRMRIAKGNDRSRRYSVETREYLEELAKFIAKIPGCPPGIPEPPGPPEQHITLEPDDDD
jgi:hypothetical protein